ncbi:MAG: hypothetical protein FJX00_02075 [Alphaproteobacteria bacterium]|nr:hypothetical protein [Alphaproteobacteria bacterium]
MTNSAIEAEMEAEMEEEEEEEAAAENAHTVGASENEVDPELVEGPTINKFMRKAKSFVTRKRGHEAHKMNSSNSVETDEKRLDAHIDALLKQIVASANSNADKHDVSVAG